MYIFHITYTISYNLLGDYMKYLKTITFEIILLLILSIISSILFYFDIISDINIIIFIITFLLSGIYISKLSNKKYYLEGIKISLINIILFLLISLIFKYKINFLYYLLIIITTIIGSLIGRLFKKKK